jgi:hypothetical protein
VTLSEGHLRSCVASEFSACYHNIIATVVRNTRAIFDVSSGSMLRILRKCLYSYCLNRSRVRKDSALVAHLHEYFSHSSENKEVCCPAARTWDQSQNESTCSPNLLRSTPGNKALAHTAQVLYSWALDMPGAVPATFCSFRLRTNSDGLV